MRIPGGPESEDVREREAWERQRYADPATGEIPKGIGFLERRFAAKMPRADHDGSGAVWLPRGPWNYGGRTRALAIDATNENRMMAGGVSGGIWLSEDGGQSWNRRTPLAAHPGCVSIAQDTRPGKTNTWYYLSGEAYGTSAGASGAFYLGDGLFKSTDNGMSWAPVSSTAGGNPQGFSTLYQLGWRVITSPKDSADVLFMACYGAIMRSANGGQTWSAVRGTTTGTAAYFTDIAVTTSGVFYAVLSSDGTHKGIWRSTNGTQWTNITPANFPAEYDRIVIGINPDNENEVYFLGATPGFGHYNYYISSEDWSSLWKYTYLSGDGSGATGQWEDRSQNLPSTGTPFDRFACQGGYDLLVKVQAGTGHVFVGGTSLWRSDDGFATPDHTTHIAGYKPGTNLPFFELYPNHHPDLHDALFLPSNPNVLFTVSDGGIHRTDDCNAAGVVWTSLNRGYQTTQYYTIQIERFNAGDNTMLGGLQDNGNLFVNSADPQAYWKQTINGDGAYSAIARDKKFYVIGTQSGGTKAIKCTLDANGNVTAFRRFDPVGPVKDDYPFINTLALDPVDDNILYWPAGNSLYRQDQLGDIQLTGAWDSIAQGWTMFPDTTVGDITAIGVSTANPTHRVYFGTSARRIYRLDNADSANPVRTEITVPGTPQSSNVSCLAVDPDNGNRVIVTYSNYGVYSIYVSDDAGQSWQKVAGNLESSVGGSGSGPSVRWLSILPLPNGGRKYFCATSVGLYSADTLILHTITTGTKWVLESPDVIGTSVVDHIAVRPSDGLVVVATHGTGIYAANYTPVSGVSEKRYTPQVSVTPNPVVSRAHFRVSGVPEGPVRVRVYDLQGRQLRQAYWPDADEELELGNLDSGVYLYEIQGPGWRANGKIVKT